MRHVTEKVEHHFWMKKIRSALSQPLKKRGEEKGGGKHAAISPLSVARGDKCARLILPQSADAVFAKIYVGSETCVRWPIRRKLRREEEPYFLPVLSSPTTSTIRFPSIILLYSVSNHLGRMSRGEEKSGLREIILSPPHILQMCENFPE